MKNSKITVSRRAYARIAALASTTVCLVALGIPAANADASGPASCLGIEASAISPPGSTEEFPGGLPDVVRFVTAEEGSFGPAVSQFAQVHAGSHEACDAAVGE